MVILMSPSIILLSFCSLAKKRPLISCSLLLCPEGAQTQRTLLLERVFLKDTNLPFGVNLSDTFKTWMKLTKHSLCVNIPRRKKDRT